MSKWDDLCKSCGKAKREHYADAEGVPKGGKVRLFCESGEPYSAPLQEEKAA